MFRKNSTTVTLFPDVERFQTEIDFVNQVSPDGSIKQNLVYRTFEVHDPEVLSSLPTVEEYTLENLLSAGVPLDIVPTSDLLNPSDSAHVDRIAFAYGNKFVDKNSQPIVEPVTDKKDN